MAITGGVSCILDPQVFITLSSARMASPSGKCHTFSQDADGYARGEGCGIVLLKRLDKAKKDWNKIWGTIKTGLNQDGRMNTPITAPSGLQQVELMEKMYQESGVGPESVQYIEAHGTGTQIGDFVEVGALGSFFGKEENSKTKIGSVKTNIGHLESAAGVAGLIKVLLMMHHGKYVPTLHADVLNTKIPFEKYKFSVSRETSSWNIAHNGTRTACMNCFGFGGTNSHAIIQRREEKYALKRKHQGLHTCLGKENFVLLSAENKESLKQMIMNLQKQVIQSNDLRLDDLSSTSIYHRNFYRCRKLLAVDSLEDLQVKLLKFGKDDVNPFPTTQRSTPDIIFVYCGVGTAWRKMCKEFIQCDKTFRDTIAEIDRHLEVLTDIRVSRIFIEEEDISDPLKNHLAIFACQIGLTESLIHIGIQPSAIVGQSVGEVAAAYACRSITLSDAVKIIYFRSWYLSQVTSGKMVVIQNISVEEVDRECKVLDENAINIAVYHSNTSCVVSGSTNLVDILSAKLSAKGAKIKPLNVKCGYHSHLVKGVGELLKDRLDDLEVKSLSVKSFSSVTGCEISNNYFASANYWKDNVSKPVLFHDAIRNARKMFDNAIFLEIGPHPVLEPHLPNIFPDTEEISFPTMNRNNEYQTFRNTFVELIQTGVCPQWKSIVQHTDSILAIPKYHLLKRKCYVRSGKLTAVLEGLYKDPQSRVLSLIPKSDKEFVLYINKENTNFVYEHIVDGESVIPGALYGTIGLALSRERNLKNGHIIEISWTIHKPLFVKDKDVALVVSLKEKTVDELVFEAFSSTDSSTVASGHILQRPDVRSKKLCIKRLLMILQTRISHVSIYSKLRDDGFQHGPIFQIIEKSVAEGRNEAISKFCLPPELMKVIDQTTLHPVIIDGMFQSCSNVNLNIHKDRYTRILPVKVKSLRFLKQPEKEMICYTIATSVMETSIVFNIVLLTNDGDIVVDINGFEIEIINSPNDIKSITFAENWRAEKIEKLALDSERPLLIFSWNKFVLHKIGNSIQKENNALKILSCLVTESFDYSCVKKYSVADIIIIPGMRKINENMTTEQVLGETKASCHFLLDLLQIFYNSNTHMTVITQDTQCLTENTSVGVFGSELWGMVRSAAQEGTSMTFTLIDVHGDINENLENIMMVISNSHKSEGIHIPHEYALINDKIYCNQIEKIPSSFHDTTFLMQSNQNTESVFIRTETQGGLSTYFGYPCNSETLSDNKTKAWKIKPQLVLKYPDSGKPCLPEHYWASNTNNGSGIPVIEIVGTSSLDGKTVEVIGCCPKHLSTHVLIEKELIVLKSVIPNYKIGDVYFMITAFSIANVISHRAAVYIIHDVENGTLTEFLTCLLLAKRCRIELSQPASSSFIRSLQATHIVCLTKNDFNSAGNLKTVFPHATNVIIVGTTITKESIFVDESISLFVINIDDIFKDGRLDIMIKKAVKYLSTSCRNILKSRTEKEQCYFNKNVLDVSKICMDLKIRKNSDLLIRSNSAYIVVGGLTGLGWLVVKYLSQKGAKLIISLSRRSITDDMKNCLANIQFLRKTEIIHRTVDITEPSQVNYIIKSLQTQFPNIPIKGVFQGGAVLNDNIIPRMTKDTFYKPLNVKVSGTWNLHRATRHLDLDFFIMHSSIASIFGNYAQSNYSAANAFIDCFAFYRRSLGLPAQTINWGALEIGMASDPNLAELFSYKGINLLTTGQIQNALSRAMLANRVQTIFVSFDLRKFLASTSQKWAYSKFVTMEAMSDVKDIVTFSSQITTESSSPTTELISTIKSISSAVLMIDTSEVKDDSVLLKFGLDSQNAVEIANLLYSSTDVRLPIFIFLSGEYNVSEIAQMIREKTSKQENANVVDYNNLYQTPTMTGEQFMEVSDENKGNQSPIIIFDYKIMPELDKPELWKAVIFHIFAIHPELRIKYSPTKGKNNENSITKITIDKEDVIYDFLILPIETSTEALDSFQNIFSLSLPFRALYLNGTRQSTLRLIFSRLYADAKCGSIILKEMQIIAAYLIAEGHVPAHMIHTPIDTARVMTKKVQPVLEEGKVFWTEKLRSSTSSTVYGLSSESPLELSDKDIISHSCQSWLVKELRESLHICSGRTLLSIICSAYQIVLHKLTKLEIITVLTTFDLRREFPELQSRIVPCENRIPLISTTLTEKNLRFVDVVKRNDIIVGEARENDLLPYRDLKLLKTFQATKHSVHSLQINEISDSNGHFVHLQNIKTYQNSSFQSHLNVLYNSKDCELQFELHFCSEFMNQTNAENMLEYMEMALESIMLNPEFLVERWVPISKLLSEIKTKSRGTFMLYQQNGKMKPITLLLRETPVAELQWGWRDKSKLTVSDISSVFAFQLNGKSAIRLKPRTRGRKDVTLVATSRKVRDAWVEFIKGYLTSSEKTSDVGQQACDCEVTHL